MSIIRDPGFALEAILNTMFTTGSAVSIRFADSIADEIETTYDEITKRAYELFLQRSCGAAIDIEDWLARSGWGNRGHAI